MNVFETSYSNLFAAGLRVIHSRSTSRRSSSDSQLRSLVSHSPSTGAVDHDQLSSVSSRAPSSGKTFHFPTRLWRLPSPRNEESESAGANMTAAKDATSRPAHRRSMPGGIMEETTLDVRIWDWSTRVSFATTILEEEDGCVDPYLCRVDPVDAPKPARSSVLIAPPNVASLWKHELPVLQSLAPSRPSQRDRRVSLQALPVHTMAPKRPFYSTFELGEDTVWESTSESSDDESDLDDDWHQFRVEWIDFDVAH